MAPSVGVGVGVTSFVVVTPSQGSPPGPGDDDMSVFSVTFSQSELEALLSTPQELIPGVAGQVIIPISLLFSHENPGAPYPVANNFASFNIRWANLSFGPLMTADIDMSANISMVTSPLLTNVPSTEALQFASGESLIIDGINFELGAILDYTITDPGSGYGPNENIGVTGGTGADFLAVATVSGWYPIAGGNANNPSFAIAGNHTSDFTASSTFTVTGTENGNDGTYTVVSSNFSSGVTSINTVEAIPSGNPVGSSGHLGPDSDPHEIISLAVSQAGYDFSVSDELTLGGFGTGSGATMTVTAVGTGLGGANLVLVYQMVTYP